MGCSPFIIIIFAFIANLHSFVIGKAQQTELYPFHIELPCQDNALPLTRKNMNYLNLIRFLHLRAGGISSRSLSNNNDLDYDDSSSLSEFSFGKDRELFHATIDLKWILRGFTNKESWIKVIFGAWERIKRLYPPYDLLCSYRQSALEIAKSLRLQDSKSSLKIFQSSLLHAQYFSTILDRPILVYIEDSASLDGSIITPSLETVLLRKALTNQFVEDLINEKFIFVATSSTHPYTQKLIKLCIQQEKLSPTQPLEYPMILLLIPKLSAKDYFPTPTQLEDKEDGNSLSEEHYSNPLQFMKFKSTLELEVGFVFHPVSSSSLTGEQIRFLFLKLLKQFYEQRQEEYETFLQALANSKPSSSSSMASNEASPDVNSVQVIKNDDKNNLALMDRDRTLAVNASNDSISTEQ